MADDHTTDDLRVYPDEQRPPDPAPEPEPTPTPEPEPEDDPNAARSRAEERIQELARQNEEYRQLLLQAQSELIRRTAPAYDPARQNRDPFDDPSLSPEWKQSLQVTERYLAPVIEQRMQPLLQQVAARQAQTEAMNERLLLHQAAARDPRYADYPALEPQILAIRQNLAAQGNPLANAPLEGIYAYVKMMQGNQAPQVQEAERRGAQRARAAVNARVETAVPAGTAAGRTSGALTPERIAAMSTQELEALIAQNQWEI